MKVSKSRVLTAGCEVDAVRPFDLLTKCSLSCQLYGASVQQIVYIVLIDMMMMLPEKELISESRSTYVKRQV